MRLRTVQAAYPRLYPRQDGPCGGTSEQLKPLLGLAPSGGCLAARITTGAGGLLHMRSSNERHLFTLTGCRLSGNLGGLFLWPDPAGNRSMTGPHPGCYPALCSLECGLSSPLRLAPRAAIARPTWSSMIHVFGGKVNPSRCVVRANASSLFCPTGMQKMVVWECTAENRANAIALGVWWHLNALEGGPGFYQVDCAPSVSLRAVPKLGNRPRSGAQSTRILAHQAPWRRPTTGKRHANLELHLDKSKGFM